MQIIRLLDEMQWAQFCYSVSGFDSYHNIRGVSRGKWPDELYEVICSPRFLQFWYCNGIFQLKTSNHLERRCHYMSENVYTQSYIRYTLSWVSVFDYPWQGFNHSIVLPFGKSPFITTYNVRIFCHQKFIFFDFPSLSITPYNSYFEIKK